MILEKGNMWSIYGQTDMWLFTGNSYITVRGRLVMGRGLAKEVKDKFPGLDAILGDVIRINNEIPQDYGLAAFSERTGGFIRCLDQRIGAFQVKRHFQEPAKLSLIGFSVCRLSLWIELWGLKRVDLNFPGIGYGRLPRSQVLPIIQELPDVVRVWERS